MGDLEHQILLSLVVTGRMEGSRTLRIWSVGCGTGEEPYAIAMLLHRLLRDRRAWTMSILAAESNPARLAVARRGCYPAASLRETPRDIRDRYFRRCGPEMYAVDPRIRSMVTFALLEAPAPAGIAPSLDAAGTHLILCRKWSGRRLPPRAQAAMGARFETALVPGGWLVPDPGLHPALVRPFVPVRFPAAVVYRKPLAAGPSAPTTPTSQRPAGTGRVIHRGQPLQPPAGGARPGPPAGDQGHARHAGAPGAGARPGAPPLPHPPGPAPPRRPGARGLRHLQRDPRTRDIPVVVISADATPGQVERLNAAGARAYLTKPLDVRALLAAVDDTLGRRARA